MEEGLEKEPLAVSQSRLSSSLTGEIVCFPWVSIQSVNEFVTHIKTFVPALEGLFSSALGKKKRVQEAGWKVVVEVVVVEVMVVDGDVDDGGGGVGGLTR